MLSIRSHTYKEQTGLTSQNLFLLGSKSTKMPQVQSPTASVDLQSHDL